MDSKNVIAAISLSAAVIILYSLFFAPSPEQINLQQNKNKQEQVQKKYILQVPFARFTNLIALKI